MLWKWQRVDGGSVRWLRGRFFVEFWRLDWSRSMNSSFAGAILHCSRKWEKWRESRQGRRRDVLFLFGVIGVSGVLMGLGLKTILQPNSIFSVACCDPWGLRHFFFGNLCSQWCGPMLLKSFLMQLDDSLESLRCEQKGTQQKSVILFL